jgi:transcriptional regulator with XRE-family HTH domain
MSEAEAPTSRTLAERLEHLFRTVHPSGRGEYSSEEVANAIAHTGGPTISATYIWMLRKGTRDNPTKKHIEALSDFFGVPPAYFFDDESAARIESELAMVAALRDAAVQRVALRASGLSSESLAALADMIDRVRTLEGLPHDPDSQEGAVRSPQ